jgi:hypothetical protein
VVEFFFHPTKRIKVGSGFTKLLKMLLSLYKKSTSWFYQFIDTQNDKENMNRTTSRRIHRAQAMRARTHTHWNGINLVQANKTRDLPRYDLNLKSIPAVCRPCRFRAFAVCCSRSLASCSSNGGELGDPAARFLLSSVHCHPEKGSRSTAAAMEKKGYE